MDVSELKSIISRKLEIPISDIGGEDFREYGVRFHYLGSSYRATTDLAVEKVDGGCLVTDDDARRIEKLLRTEEWDGEGLPPVGCECQYDTNGYGTKMVRVECITKDGIAFTWLGEDPIFRGLDCINTSQAHRFRHIRSEADKKKEAVLSQIANAIIGDVPDTGMATAAMYAERIYDAIKSGKIVID